MRHVIIATRLPQGTEVGFEIQTISRNSVLLRETSVMKRHREEERFARTTQLTHGSAESFDSPDTGGGK